MLVRVGRLRSRLRRRKSSVTVAYATVKARHEKRKPEREAADSNRREREETKKQKLNDLLALVGNMKPSDRDEVLKLPVQKLKALLLRDDMLNYHERHAKLTKKGEIADMVCVLYGY